MLRAEVGWTSTSRSRLRIHAPIVRRRHVRHGPMPCRNDAAQSLLLGLRHTKLKCCRDWQESVPTQVS